LSLRSQPLNIFALACLVDAPVAGPQGAPVLRGLGWKPPDACSVSRLTSLFNVASLPTAEHVRAGLLRRCSCCKPLDAWSVSRLMLLIKSLRSEPLNILASGID